MKNVPRLLTALALLAAAPAAPAADEWLDRLSDALTVNAFDGNVRARFSGLIDLEGYRLPNPAPGLFFTDKRDLFNPRLTLFLDAQLGPYVYAFAQARADRGFDPGYNDARVSLDEYALRVTPWDDGRLSLQVGKFATVVGNWTTRHDSWTNPFLTAPLPYENLTGIWDGSAADSLGTLQGWAHVSPEYLNGTVPDGGPDKHLRVPIIWGPSYTSGLSVAGRLGRFEYAAEVKNAALSSRPKYWDGTVQQWQHPTVSARLGFRPNEMWNLGFSASTGSYLLPSAKPTLAPGALLNDYRETVLAQDVSFAWHHWQVWAEFFETRFEIPGVGHADTFAYYVEAKYKITAQLFGALRWNQQLFSDFDIPVSNDPLIIPPDNGRWGRDIYRLDAALGYRFTAHTQLKLQYSVQHEDAAPKGYSHTLGAQFTVKF